MTISQSHDSPSDIAPKALSNDEYQLAQLGYKQGIHLLIMICCGNPSNLSKNSSAPWGCLRTGQRHSPFVTLTSVLATYILTVRQTMNFISGIPMMFAFVMSTGGPEAAFANWTMVGGFSFIVSLAMAEIASALPVAGGIYYWSFYLGGKKWGPFLSWMTAVRSHSLPNPHIQS